MASPFQRNENTVQLFLSTEPQKLYYKGPCAVDIKVLSQLFIVEPCDKDTNAVEISVYSPFNKYKNILCHISTQNNIALIFPTVEACKTVYDIIFKYQVDVKQEVDDLLSNHQLQNQILIPLFNEAKSNSLIHERTKHCIIDMLQDLASAAAEEILRNTNMKSELNEPLPFESQPSSKESSPTLCDTLASIVNQPLDRFQQNISVKGEPEEAVHVESDDLKLNVERLEPVENLQNESRKRRLSSENLNTVVQNKQCKIEVMDEQANLTPLQPQTSQGTLMATKKIIKSTHFVVHRITNYGYRKHELILFISDEKNLCYPYFYKKKNTGNCFTCINCLKSKSSVVAHLRCSESGEYFLELGLIKHVCAPENYNDRHYLYIEPCTSYSSLFFETQITKKKKPASLQTKSHSFAQLSKFNAISAESSQASSHNIRVETSQTLPNVTVTEESDIGAPKKILQSPDFELQIIKNYYGVKKYQLITFIAPDHELCYIYYQEYPNMRFQCKKCQNLRPNITAYLREGDDGKKYVFFNEHEHHCKPILYSSLTPKSDILEDSEYCISYSREGNIRPIVFDSIDRNLCYIFSHQKYNRFICDECESKDSPATLLKSKETNGEYFWKWKSSVHSCEPKILSTEEQEKVLMSAQFKFFNDNNDASNDLKLITFPYNDENVKSHIYIYSNVLDTFCCIKCLESDHLVIADVYLNSQREEYILESNPTKHICEPSVYSNLNLKNIVFKETSGLEVKKFYEKNWEEKNMLQAGNFKFQRNRDGVLNALLIIFTNEEKDCCYKYYYDGFAGLYYCHQCKVSAKTFVDENDKCFVRLSLVKHRCQPILYESEKKIVRKPDFLVLDDTKPQRLIVFTSSSRRKCYVYSGARFRCNKCVKFALTIDATLFNDENDERCVLLGRREHQCKPLKFENVAKKYNINC